MRNDPSVAEAVRCRGGMGWPEVGRACRESQWESQWQRWWQQRWWQQAVVAAAVAVGAVGAVVVEGERRAWLQRRQRARPGRGHTAVAI